jgi:hypothetical protein
MHVRYEALGVGFALVAFAAATLTADDTPKAIKPDEARKHLGETVEVVFTVQASKDSKHRKTVYLDSEKDFRDQKNLGVAISEKGVSDLKQQRGVDAPAEYYRGKKIRVVGKIVIRDERPYIDVDEARQLDLAKDESSR